MQYVYIIQSKKNGETYVGCTKDLKTRLILHNTKKVASTKNNTPFALIYYEAYINSKDAFNREKYMKTQYGRNYIKKVLSNFFISKNFLG
ncbi:MAG: GIY-YIG nuclease family protein [bacterium]